MDHRVAVFPSLYSHKGTPIRILIEFDDGDRLKVEPLKVSAGGLALKASVAGQLLPNASINENALVLLGHDGSVKYEYPIDKKIASIQPMVVYPDGSTWEGKIVESRANEAGLLVWSWELARKLKTEDISDLFAIGLEWENVPTTIVFFENLQTEGVCGCFRNHHVCATCGSITKLGDDELL